MDNIYNEKLCNELHSNLKEQIVVISKKLDDHTDQITTIEKANIKLTQILDMLTKQTETTKVSFWESKTGGRLLTFIMVAIGATLTVAIGLNIMDKIPL